MIEIKIIISTPPNGGTVLEVIPAGEPANDKENALGGLLMYHIARMVDSLEGGHRMDAGSDPKGN